MVANSDKVDKDIVAIYFDFCFAIGMGNLHVVNRRLSDESKTVNDRSALALRHA